MSIQKSAVRRHVAGIAEAVESVEPHQRRKFRTLLISVDMHWEIAEAVERGGIMLLHQDRGGRKQYRLLSFNDAFEFFLSSIM